MEEQITQSEEKNVSKKVNLLSIFLLILILGFGVFLLGINSNWKFKDFDWKNVCITKEESADTEITAQNSRFVSKYGFSIDVSDFSDYGIKGFTKEEIESWEEKYEVYTDLKNHWSLSLVEIDPADASRNLGKIVEDVSLLYNLSTEAWNSLPFDKEEIDPMGILNYRVEIYVYENTKSLTLETVLSEMREVNDIAGAVYGEVTYAEISGTKVAKFTGGNSEEPQENIVGIAGDYIYVIEKVVSDQTASESMDVLNSIIESIRFE